ncbi:MAG: DEAD/DEAH box helicase, partial [Sandaracinaceae bacterium]|nr:DEAD/DEAH box helicase [Sandaracinaceae bacterium]
RVLEAAGMDSGRSVPPPPEHHLDQLPQPGQVVQARHRQWLVESVHPGGEHDSARVCLVCLDDDAPGEELELLWDLEVGARVIDPAAEGLDPRGRLDPPGHFGAFLHALKWSAVSAADATRFQAPFRASIKLMAHQLTPLMKALELPRANLFIADDVGLGKTIEAGLVLQELILRQQAEYVLVACPAAICLQWRDEMQRRFGLRFEVMTAKFVAARRQERGFGINPWGTHNRFIISHQLLRRPEYREPLIAHLGPRARKSLLILDEAHVAAPASRSKYAVDSDTTDTIRGLSARFDNRLFLSATPHNGHSNSFSALLEILDPVRFTRGVPIEGPEELAPVMVRRLKRDLRQLGVERFPRRLLVQLGLQHDGSVWTASERRYDAETHKEEAGATYDLGEAEPVELQLAEKLARYTALCAPPKQGRGRLSFIRLQQRLLSSPEAFARTLEGHAQAVLERGGPVVRSGVGQQELDVDADPDVHGLDDDEAEAEAAAELSKDSRSLPSPTDEARGLLSELRALAEKARRRPDAKVRALLAWMRDHQCPAIGNPSSLEGRWTDRRVIIFTEWGDTKRYLVDLIGQAVAGTDRGDERILVFHGGMGDDRRDEVQRAFNAPPDEHPVRILIATDAAREGINLQAYCADLFHFDLPWNPARLEQRNGRIDRTLQEAAEVRCHYLIFPQRREDRVLETLVRKVEIVQQELGSLGAVLLRGIEKTLDAGIDDATAEQLDLIGQDVDPTVVDRELESQRKELAKLEADRAMAARRLEASARALQVHPESLRGVVEVGLRMAGADGLIEGERTREGHRTFLLPSLDRSWDRTLDSLRPPRRRDERFWEWRQHAPRPVTFEPLARMTSETEQLHLAHPVLRRVLDRFLAQGFSAHDLSRVSAVVAPDDTVIRVLAYARLSLFGPGAARLHDEIIAIPAPWSGGDEPVEPYKDPATAQRAIESTERLLALGASAPGATLAAKITARAAALYAELWPALEDEADARAVAARNGLSQRARREADELRALLRRQKRAIEKQTNIVAQMELFAQAETKTDREQQRQLKLDHEHMRARYAGGEGRRRRPLARRAGDQGRPPRGPERGRARGRHAALVRARARGGPPGPARRQEPLRLGGRGRPLPHGSGRPRRRHRPERAARPPTGRRPAGGRGLGALVRRRPPGRGRGPGARRRAERGDAATDRLGHRPAAARARPRGARAARRGRRGWRRLRRRARADRAGERSRARPAARARHRLGRARAAGPG